MNLASILPQSGALPAPSPSFFLKRKRPLISTSYNLSDSVRLIASERNWIEGEAVRQLGRAAALPGVFAVAGLPDLHPGGGIPVGAAIASRGLFDPPDRQRHRLRHEPLAHDPAPEKDEPGPWAGAAHGA